MTSMFDSDVRERREHTPWARVSFRSFAREMIWNDPSPAEEPVPADKRGVVLRCDYRRGVSSGEWWTLEWTGEDGSRHQVESQYYDLLLWRAAEVEMRTRARLERERKGGEARG